LREVCSEFTTFSDHLQQKLPCFFQSHVSSHNISVIYISGDSKESLQCESLLLNYGRSEIFIENRKTLLTTHERSMRHYFPVKNLAVSLYRCLLRFIINSSIKTRLKNDTLFLHLFSLRKVTLMSIRDIFKYLYINI